MSATVSGMGEHRPGPGPAAHHLRWWVWPLLVILLAAALMIAIRAHGWTCWQRAQADLDRLGFPTTARSYVAAAPPVDRERNDRLWRVLRNTTTNWSEWRTGAPFDDLRAGAMASDTLLALQQALQEGTADMEAIGAVLDDGPVLVSVLGWIERDPQLLQRLDPDDLAALRAPAMLAGRACAAWWGAKACLGGDPAPWLRRLRQWRAAIDRPGLLIDVSAGLATAAARDSVHLWLATRGTISDADLESWVAEAPPHRRWGADSLAGERCLVWEPQMRTHSLLAILIGSAAWSDDFNDRFDLLRFHHGAWACTELARQEAYLRGTPPPTPAPRGPLWSSLHPDTLLPNLASTLSGIVEAEFRHRVTRIAGLLAARYRAGRALPADQAALAARLPRGRLDGATSNHPAIRYQRLAAARFRLGIDPALPLPEGIPTERWRPDYGSAIGEPASLESVEDRTWSLELDLDAILIPMATPVLMPLLGP